MVIGAALVELQRGVEADGDHVSEVLGDAGARESVDVLEPVVLSHAPDGPPLAQVVVRPDGPLDGFATGSDGLLLKHVLARSQRPQRHLQPDLWRQDHDDGVALVGLENRLQALLPELLLALRRPGGHEIMNCARALLPSRPHECELDLPGEGGIAQYGRVGVPREDATSYEGDPRPGGDSVVSVRHGADCATTIGSSLWFNVTGATCASSSAAACSRWRWRWR
mmetsp:Transcript_226/g.467  ORF Transcript_226/g.467 Transcript_226/m.467 type:complete len:224 (-) Transcript_226:88-759(-)